MPEYPPMEIGICLIPLATILFKKVLLFPAHRGTKPFRRFALLFQMIPVPFVVPENLFGWIDLAVIELFNHTLHFLCSFLLFIEYYGFATQ